MPSSSMAATRPCTCTLPVVGSVVPVIIFSKVLLPAPLMPMRPTASPGVTVKLMSCRIQCSVWRVPPKGSSHSANRARRLGYFL